MRGGFGIKIFALFAFSGTFAQVSAPFTVDFERHPAGSYTTAMAKQDFPEPNSGSYWYYGMDQGRSEIADEDGNKVLRVQYPAGCVGPNDTPTGCGIQVKWPLPESADTMWASYRLKFETGFDFVKGGKLPGLCGGKCYSGGSTPSQGDGWSARIMWRTGGAIVQYMYFTDQAAQYGDDMKWDKTGTQKTFGTDSWDTVVTQVILNTVPSGASQGLKNGIVRSWFNGELSLEVDTLRLVDYSDQKIDMFYISTFHGGDNATWAPAADSYIRYDDFRISVTPPDYLNPEIPNGFSVVPPAGSAELRMKLTRNALHLSRPLPEPVTLKMLDSKGRVVWNAVLAPGQNRITVPSLPSGIYGWSLRGSSFRASGILENAASGK